MLPSRCHRIAKLYRKALSVLRKGAFPHLLFAVQRVYRITRFLNPVLIRLNRPLHPSGIHRRNRVPHGGNVHRPCKPTQGIQHISVIGKRNLRISGRANIGSHIVVPFIRVIAEANDRSDKHQDQDCRIP